MKLKRILLGSLFGLLLASNCYAVDSQFNNGVNMAQDLTIEGNLSVNGTTKIHTLEVEQSLTGQTIVQVVNVMETDADLTTTLIPLDNTIPQITEGDEAFTLAITPTLATNILKIDVVLQLSHSVNGATLIGALFQDTTADALAAMSTGQGEGGNLTNCVAFTYWMVAGTASETTFKARYGSSSAGNCRLNGIGSIGQIFGGASMSSMTITEIKA